MSTDDPAGPIAVLFDAHGDFVWRTLQHFGVQDAAVDDAVQDVFVTAHRRWSTFEGRSSHRSWLFGIARRIAFRYRRSARARAQRFETSTESPHEGIAEPFNRLHAAHSLAAMLGQLDTDKRSAFVLSELEGMTAPEIADALGVPVGTVYSRIRASWRVLGREASRERTRLRGELAAMPTPPMPAERRQRIWGLIAASMSPDVIVTPVAASAGMGWLSQIQWVLIGGAVTAGLLGARIALVAPDPPPARRVAADRAEPAPPSVVEPARHTPTPAPSAALQPTPERRTNTRATPVPSPSRRRATPPRPEPEIDPLAAELALVRRAQRAIVRGEGTTALELLDEHARRFPRGQLVDERKTAKIEALCAAGRPEQAAQQARALGRDPALACP